MELDKIKNKGVVNLVLFYCDVRFSYGLKSHINPLVEFLKNKPDIHITVIKTDERDCSYIQCYTEDNTDIIVIPSPENKIRFIEASESLLQKKYAKRLAEIIKVYIGHLQNVIFWIHGIYYLNVCYYIRELFNRSRILYVHHAWGWKLFNNVSDESFSKLWKMNNNINDRAFIVTNQQQKIAKVADLVITVTNQAKMFYIKTLNIPKQKLRVIYNGSDPVSEKKDKKALRIKYGIEKNDKVLIFVGRIKHGKGILYLLSAFKKVVSIYNNIKLFIVGDGDFNQFIPLINPYWSKVIYTGEIEQRQVQELYEIADIGILPSLHEQCSFAAIEMRFNRIPLIVSSVDGLDEMFEDRIDCLKIKLHFNKNGNFILKGEEIAKKIIQLLLDENLRERLAENSYQKALKEFTKDKMCMEYYNTIKYCAGELLTD